MRSAGQQAGPRKAKTDTLNMRPDPTQHLLTRPAKSLKIYLIISAITDLESETIKKITRTLEEIKTRKDTKLKKKNVAVW